MPKQKSTSGTDQPANEEMVLTPGGWRPKSTVHRIEPGHHLSRKGGRFQKIHTASGKVVADYGEISVEPSDNPPGKITVKKKTAPSEGPYPDNGWIIDFSMDQ